MNKRMSTGKIRIIDHESIMNLHIAPMTCYRWVEEMLLQKSNTILPPKTSIKLSESSFYNIMPSVLLNENRMGVKAITRRNGQPGPSLTSQIMLHDSASGELLALMDGNFITAMRTGAVAAFSVRLFAVEDFKTIGVMGLGVIAAATMDILMELYKEKSFVLRLLKYKSQAEEFRKRYEKYENVKFEIVDSAEEICRSDVVISCVTYQGGLFAPDSCFKEGCTVIPVHTRGFQNCDLFFDKVFADDEAHVKGFKYFSEFRRFAEVSDVLTEKKPGRENSKERILAYNIGLSIHDIYFANKIYEMSDGAPECEFVQPEAKNWL